jgi:hypothetical protein
MRRLAGGGNGSDRLVLVVVASATARRKSASPAFYSSSASGSLSSVAWAYQPELLAAGIPEQRAYRGIAACWWGHNHGQQA